MQKTPTSIYLYRSFVVPMAVFVGFVMFLFHPKFRQSILLKLRAHRPRRPGGVWVHAASGEFEYAKPLLPLLLTRFSNVLVTYTSPSYKRNIENSPHVTESSPLPLDLPGPVQSFLNAAKPQAILFSRTDLWPELIWQAKLRGIPTYAFAVTERSKTDLLSQFAGRIKAQIYNQLSGIFCVSDEDQKNLLSIGVTQPIFVLGDPRIDQVLIRVTTPSPKTRLLPESEALTLTLGSTWPEDERMLWCNLEPLLLKKKIRILWAPHEPSEPHYLHSQHRFDQLGIKLIKYSELSDFDPGSIAYVDLMGVLADLYASSEVSFVGGSFKAKVHSVMEPLAHGNWVWVGPKNQNNREAQIFKTYSAPLGFMVQELQVGKEIESALNKAVLANDNLWNEQRRVTKERLATLQGASQKIVDRL